MSSSFGRRVPRLLAAVALAASLVLPASTGAARAADKLVLRVGTTQDLDSMNPFQTALVVGYEAFTLNYDLLVGFGEEMEPVPGYAASWSQSTDGLTWTFKIRPGMKWSDGQPATSEDARWTLQFVADAAKAGTSIGLGYLDPYVKNAAIATVSAPDPETLVVTTSRPNDRLLAMFVPILPKHVWGDLTVDTIADFNNQPASGKPVVGTGPYQAVEWQTGQYARFDRNPYWWGNRGAEDEIVLQFFPDATDTMVQAFKKGELDYVRGPSADQFNQLKTIAGVTTVSAPGNGFSQLAFNCYDKDIPGGGASTKAVRDPAFRDALAYAVDKQALVDKVLKGYGTVGTTQVPPWFANFHVEPTDLRTFSIETAQQKLDAAGYVLNGQGQRLDKQGKPITLRIYFPNSNADYPKVAQFVADWWGQLGIKVKAQAYDGDTLVDLLLPPEAGKKYKANFDIELWGWVGDPDPNSLLEIFTTGAIGGSSDSFFSNARYDELFTLQNEAPTLQARQGYTAEMQNIVYDEAPYIIIYNDNELHAYRTDRFANWHNQPANGTPLFVNGTLNYTLLTDATATPAPTPTATPAPGETPGPSVAPTATPAATPAPGGGTGGTGGDMLPLLAGGGLLVVILAVGLLVWRRAQGGGPGKAEEE